MPQLQKKKNAQLIDDLCNEFEEHWTLESRGQFDAILDKAPAELREQLVTELVVVEVELMLDAGLEPKPEDYVRFGEEVVEIVGDLQKTVTDGGRTGEESDRHGQVLNNRYQLQQELGRGGMAIVYEATEIDSDRRVAIKMMQSRLSGTARQRFMREFSTIASINHPNCLDVFEYGETSEGPFFAMELFPGEPATALIDQDVNVILQSLFEIANAIDFVHSRNIVHRDIKPGNILVRPDMQQGRFEVRLTDFGLAKFSSVSSSMSDQSDFLGTVAYCSPEQVMNAEIDHRADIYSFGVVCYQLLSGVHPFQSSRSNIQAMVAAHLDKKPETLAELAPQVPGPISDLVMQMLAKEARQRPNNLVRFTQVVAKETQLELDESKQVTIDARPQKLAASFVARHQQLEAIESELVRCISPQYEDIAEWTEANPPSALFLCGKAGIGKSSLMRQIARQSIIEGAKVFEGRSFEGNLSPFQPFVEIVKQIALASTKRVSSESATDAAFATTTFLQTAGRAVPVNATLRRYAPELLRMGPDLRQFIDGEAMHASITSDESAYLYRAIASFFVDISKTMPIVLMFEDLHWADKSTLTLLRHLVYEINESRTKLLLNNESLQRRTPRIFIAVTSRSGSEYRNIESFIDGVENGYRIDLDTFDQAETLELLASLIGCEQDDISDPLLQETVKLCAGSPFFISQLIQNWLREGRIFQENGQWIHALSDGSSTENLPDSIRDSLKQRLADLPKAEAEMVLIAAVIGAVVDVDLLSDVQSGLGEFEFLDTLDNLIARNIFRETRQARRIEFAHDLLRELILSSTTAARLQKINELVGLSKEHARNEGDSKFSVAELAEHFVVAGDQQRSFEYSFQAGQNAIEAFAFEDAVQLLQRAADVELDLEPAKRFQLELMLAKAKSCTKDVDDSLGHYQSAYECAEDRLAKAESLYGKGLAHVKLGNIGAARDAFVSSLEKLGEKQPSTFIGQFSRIMISDAYFFFRPKIFAQKVNHLTDQEHRLLSMLSSIYWVTVGSTDAFGAYYSVIRNAVIQRNTADLPSKAIAYGQYATFASMGGLSWKGRGCRKWVEKNIDDFNSEWWRATVAKDLGATHFFDGNFDQAAKYLNDCTGYFDKARDWQYSLCIHWWRHLYSAIGDSDQIVKYSELEIESGKRTKDKVAESWGKYGLADGLGRQGNTKRALELAREACDYLEDFGTSYTVAYAELGRAQLQASKYSEAVESLTHNLHEIRKGLVYMEITMVTLPLLVEALLADQWISAKVDKDKLKRAKKNAWWAGRIVTPFITHRPLCNRVFGRLAQANGKTEKAIKYFEKAIQIAEKTGAKYDLARSLIDKSRIAQSESAQLREQGLQILDSLGCVLPVAEQSL